MPEGGWIWLLIGFAGGVFGAALGAFPAFMLCGASLVVGSVIAMVTGDWTFLLIVTWGPFLGPQASLSGGVAAAAYAASRGRLASGRDLLNPLIRLKSPAVLAVGGLFGLLGTLLAWLSSLVPNAGAVPWINPVAIAIVVNGVLTRMIFGRTGLFGRVPAGSRRWAPGPGVASFPWHLRPLPLIILSVAVSVPVAAVVGSVPTHGLFLGLSALALASLLFGWRVPVFLHIAAAAELFASVTGSFGWGIAGGVLAGLLGELFACLFLIHGDTHLDPPAMVLGVMFALSPLAAALGSATPGLTLPIAVALAISLAGFAILSALAHPNRRRWEGTESLIAGR